MSFDSTWNYVNTAGKGGTVTNAVGFITLGSDGFLKYGGSYTSDLSSTQLNALNSGGFTKIYAGGYGMYAAQKTNGSLLIFGYITNGATDEVSIVNKLLSSSVTDVRFNYGAGAAKLSDGSVITWGNNGYESAASTLLITQASSSNIGQYQIPAVVDKSPPKVVSIDFTHKDLFLTKTLVTSWQSEINYAITATDDNSGVDAVYINYNYTVGSKGFAFSLSNYPTPNIGTVNSGTWNNLITSNIKNAGTYQIASIYVRDKAGNYTSYYPSDFASLGLSGVENYNLTVIDDRLSSSTTSVDEGSSAKFTFVTNNLATGATVSYTITGISASDVEGGNLSGTATNNGSLVTISIPIKADNLAEGTETLTLTIDGATSSIQINDTSKSATPTYSLQSLTGGSVNEGTTATFTLTTTNVASGTSVPYVISGISAADVSGGSLSGNAVVNTSGIATISVSLLKDSLTEGSEILTLTAGGANASTVVTDTSLTPTYFLTSGVNNVAEGNTVTFSLQTTNIPSGTTLPYQISGVSAADIVGGNLTGSVLVSSPYSNESSSGSISIQLAADLLTEGRESLTVIVGNSSSTVAVEDTSVTPIYEIYAGNASYNEGQTAEFVFSAKNVSAFTSLTYAISGVSSSDIGSGTLSGTIQFSSGPYGYTFYLPLANDGLTEGDETLTVSIGGVSASAVIKDTSKAAAVPTYSLVASNASINEGSTANFTLTTTNVASGASVPYTITGISAADVPGGVLSGNAVVNSSGVATISVLLNNDGLTEGLETFTVIAGGATATTTVIDTSIAATYSLSSSSTSVNEGGVIVFTLRRTNNAIDWGASVPYTLSGISAADVSGGSLSGTTNVDFNGQATISVTLLSDNLTEGSETLTATAGGATASTVVNDTSKSTITPTYSVASTNSSFNEGSTATFILTTTNVSAGTSIWYSFSGISSADISGGSLSGYATIATNGQATISVLLSNDNLTEGSETLTVTTGATSTTNGVTASIQINDTSISPLPTYSVRTNWTSTTEGTPIVATLTTSNVSAGTTLFYTLNGVGITTSDFGGLSLSGSSVINSLGQATLNIPLAADITTEGDETFVIQYYTDSGRTIPAGSGAFVTIQDTSKSAVTPTYAVSANNSSVNEGSNADFTITTSNVSAGSSISYSLSGVSSSDITGGSLTGFAAVNSIGSATVSIPIAADSLTEGTETLTISLQGKTASVQINDTSKAAVVPTYALVASSSSVNEGSVALFNLTTTGVSPGTSVPFTISGVSTSDVTGGLSGTATVDTNGLASISVPIAADFLTEGSETLTVTAQGKSASVVIIDTSKTTLVPSYALSASTNSVSEGSNAVFTLTTTNVTGGTSISYTISGVSSADITGGALSGTAIVSSNGNATITIPINSDLTTEGTESLTVTAQGISSSVLISDTSITPVVIAPISNVTSIPYGDGKYFYGSSGSDKVTGTSFVDVVKQTSTISSNQLTKLSDGSWQIQNKITPSNSDNLVNVERVEFSDMSVALDVSGPAGQVAKILGSVFGPSYVSNTEFAGIGFAYLDGGMSYLDLCGLAAGAAGLSTPDLLVTTLLRNTTGTEPTALSKSSYLQSISNGSSYASVVQQIADSSANAQSIKLTDIANTGLAFKPYVFPPTYSLSTSAASVNEGSTAIFNLTTTNVAVGTEVNYTLSGISSSDLMSGTLNGKVTIGAGGVASINVPIASDGATEGQESLTISAQGATASIAINDTSKSIALPTYTLTPATLSVNEGELARIYVNTTNVAAGTALQYGISGLSANDLIGDMTRLVNVDSLGQAFINIQILADQITEGPETMYITMGTSISSLIINDTSVTLVGVIDSGGGDSGGGDGGGGDGGGY